MTTNPSIFHFVEKPLNLPNLHHHEDSELKQKALLRLQLIDDYQLSSSFGQHIQQAEKTPEDSQKIMDILKFEKRSLTEAESLYEHLKDFAFFDKFTERNPLNNLGADAFAQLCQKARYEKHPARKVLYKEGDAPTGKVYLVYSGSVHSYSKNSKANTRDNMSQNEVAMGGDSTNNSFADLGSEKDNNEKTPTHKVSFSEKMWENSPTSQGDSARHFSNNGVQEPRKVHKTTRLSIFVPGDNNSEAELPHMEKGENSQEAITKFSQKLNELQAEKRPSIKLMSPIYRKFEGGAHTHTLLRKGSDEMSPSRKPIRRKTLLVQQSPSLKRLNTLNMNEGAGNSNFSSPSRGQISWKQMTTENGVFQEEFTAGGFFGESALFSKLPRHATTVTTTECEFLVIAKKDFDLVSEKYDINRRIRLSFLREFVPDLESIAGADGIQNLLHNFQEKVFDRDSYILREGETANHLLVIFEGKCDLIKTAKVNENIVGQESLGTAKNLIRVNPIYLNELPLSKIEKGEFVGEECIFLDTGVYDFSLKAISPQVRVFMVDKHWALRKFPAQTKTKFEKSFQKKRKNRFEMTIQLLCNKYPSHKIATSDLSENSKDILPTNYITLTPSHKERRSIQQTSHTSPKRSSFFGGVKRGINSEQTLPLVLPSLANTPNTTNVVSQFPEQNNGSLSPTRKSYYFTATKGFGIKEKKPELASSRLNNSLKPRRGADVSQIEMSPDMKSPNARGGASFRITTHHDSPLSPYFHKIPPSKLDAETVASMIPDPNDCSAHRLVLNNPRDPELISRRVKAMRSTKKYPGHFASSLSPGRALEGQEEYSFANVLKSMINSAKKKKEKRVNEGLRISLAKNMTESMMTDDIATEEEALTPTVPVKSSRFPMLSAEYGAQTHTSGSTVSPKEQQQSSKGFVQARNNSPDSETSNCMSTERSDEIKDCVDWPFVKGSTDKKKSNFSPKKKFLLKDC